MPDTIERGIGSNSGAVPLTEILADETRSLKERADHLVEAAGKMTVTDETSAGNAATLAKMIRDHGALIDATREERKKPFLDGGRTVDAHFGAMRAPLLGTDAKKLGGAFAAVVSQVDEFRRKQEAAAAAERARLQREADEANRRAEEQARLRREAELREELAREATARAAREAQEKAERDAREAATRIRDAEEAARKSGDLAAAAEAARARAEADRKAEQTRREEADRQAEVDRQKREDADRRLASEIAERTAREEAERLSRAAELTAAPAIASDHGVKAFGKKKRVVEIIDLTAAIRHARKLNETAIREVVQSIFDKQARAGVADLPGATIRDESTTSIR